MAFLLEVLVNRFLSGGLSVAFLVALGVLALPQVEFLALAT